MLNKLRIPDFITLLNLVSGILSIFYSIKLDFVLAPSLLIVAVFFDWLDGKIARIIGQEGELGADLDSLADIVSFGIAPCVFAYALGNKNVLSIVVFCLFVAAGAVRLANYNATASKNRGFYTGMPITLNALIVPFAYFVVPGMSSILVYVMVACTILMVMPFRMRKL
jgi:CDP-diacylglycerol---serine O-phosphatidyltransferase